MKKTVILASSSSRRRELLEKTGLEFIVAPVGIEEKLDSSIEPAELAVSISLQKAVSARLSHPGSIIIAADTFGVLEGRLLGKPRNPGHARRMLTSMSGKCHQVITGFTILDCDSGKTISRAVITSVYFKLLSQSQIDQYVASGEPLDKAGAYAIQGAGAELVAKIEGDYSNVIGLPLNMLLQELKGFGIDLPDGPQHKRAAD
ncbi:MAG: septum formation protein Maf [Dehalococcoidia bacterium]|nr:septum formation protein Maf [Dehalococcoidia bacterium]